MLTRLSVENFVLIDRLDIELDGGLNIITGETGAGKSILLGALGLLLGSRAESGAMMDEGRNCVIEGVFEIGGYGLEGFFEENDLDYQATMTVRRVLSPGGKSRAYVNDLPAQLSTLKELGSRLIDIHSQHQSLMLGSDAFRAGILDSVAGNGELLKKYTENYQALQRATKVLREAREQAQREAREEDYLRFQSEQLQQAQLKEGEQQELEEVQNELSHAGQIREALALSAELLGEEERGVLSRLKSASQAMSHAAAFYPKASEVYERLNSAYLDLRDLERELDAEADRIDSDPQKLQLVSDRLDLIFTLQKKHGVQSVEELIALGEQYARRLEAITSSAEHIEELAAKAAEIESAARAQAAELTARRTRSAAEVKSHVEELLAQLGMPGAQFTAAVEPTGELRPTGSDTTRFLFTANRNTTPQPVEKIASGGELSRLMLALKSLVAERSMLPTVIFDEIDAGVSGRIADAMGSIIGDVARRMQVVNITHLPQVASKGATHFVVYKEETAAGTRSRIRRLTDMERIEEIAKMLSGSHITDAALSQARLLLGIPV